MKRSEAINAIRQIIKEFYPLETVTIMCAKNILDKLEEMEVVVPPDISHCHCEDCGGPYHSWEHEDEEI